MGALDLSSICLSAFAVVFILLALLALIMRIIVLVFPEKEARADAAILAAVSSAVSTLYPGTKISKFKEIK